MIKKVWKNKWIFRSLIKSIYFNFHYLPLRQAVKMPIFLYKPHLLKCKGNISIEGKISTGMIQLGRYTVSLYPNSGITFENHGGKIIFKGKCHIGNNSAISIGPKGNVIIGNNFVATASLKLTSYYHIEFKENVLCGWDCLFLDTDFHQLTTIKTPQLPKPYGKISIGDNCWFSLKCTIMKGTNLAENNVVAANSLLNKDYANITYCLLAGQPAKVKKKDIYLNPLNDKINF